MNPIICPMEGSGSDEISENSLSESNLRGFNNNVGSATNKASAIRDKMFMFEEDSKEYKELFRREQSIQRIQQSIIDSVKNGKSEQVPSCWYDNNKNIIIDESYVEEFIKKHPNKKPPELDSEDVIEKKLFNQRIVADKKPYYFSYIYPEIMNSIKKYEDNWKHNCIRLCGLTVDELKLKPHKTDREQFILDNYNDNYPVNNSNSVMNRICRIFEREFDCYFTKKENKAEFDYSILKSNTPYAPKLASQIKKIEVEYRNEVKQFFTDKRNGVEFEDSELARTRFIQKYRELAIRACENKYQLCDIVIDLTYGVNKNHQFAWDICGDVIIENLLKLNDNKIVYFQKDVNGTIQYGGEAFTKRKMTFELETED